MAVNIDIKGIFSKILSANKLTKANKSKFFLSACAVCFALFFCYLYFARNGIIAMADESFYLTLADRIMKGDRVVLEEWHLTQLMVFFVYVPYWLFVKITGSTDGVVLFMRYIYITSLFLTYWFIIYKLRKTPVQAVLSAALFCSYIPMGIKALSYYTLPHVFMLAVCFALINDSKKWQILRLIFAGILISATVLMVPGFLIVWVIYSIVVLCVYISKRKGKNRCVGYEFVLDIKVWLFLLLGVIISASAFFVYLHFKGGLVNVFKTLPYLFTDSEYSFSFSGASKHFFEMFDNILTPRSVTSGGNVWLFLWEKTTSVIGAYNIVFVLAGLIILALSIFYNISARNGKEKIKLKIGIIIASSIIMILALLCFGLNKIACVKMVMLFPAEPPLILSFQCLVYSLLCKNKSNKWFLFWVVGVALSLSKDVFSDLSYGSGLSLCCVYWAYIFLRVIIETYEESIKQIKNAKKNEKTQMKNGKKYATLCAFAFVLLFLSTVLWGGRNIYSENRYTISWEGFQSDDYSERIERGPYKNIYCSKELKEANDSLLSDMDFMLSISDGKVYVLGELPFMYLYKDSSYCVYTTYFVPNDAVTRAELYWRLNPEKRPQIVYAPLINSMGFTGVLASKDEFDTLPEEEYRDFGWFEGKAKKGRCGLIIEVEKWIPITA